MGAKGHSYTRDRRAASHPEQTLACQGPDCSGGLAGKHPGWSESEQKGSAAAPKGWWVAPLEGASTSPQPSWPTEQALSGVPRSLLRGSLWDPAASAAAPELGEPGWRRAHTALAAGGGARRAPGAPPAPSPVGPRPG